MTKKLENIKSLLRKHKYEVYVEINSTSSGKIKAFFPQRKEPPVIDEMSIVYYIDQQEYISFAINKEEGEDIIPCKKYIFDNVIFADINRMCDFYGYSKELVGFYLDGQIVEEPLFKQSLINNLELNKEQLEKKDIVSKLLEGPSKEEGQLDLFSEEIKDQYSMIKQMSENFNE